MRATIATLCTLTLLAWACDKKPATKDGAPKGKPAPAKTTEAGKGDKAAATAKTPTATDAKPKPTPKPAAAKAAPPQPGAKLGQPAPAFTLKGVDGASVSLSQFKGKTVVIEWYNPDCPFVVRAHKEGVLIDMAKTYTAKGVVWLAINSGGIGKQGHGVKRNKESLAEYKLEHPILIDEDGKVGRQYGAKTTPHMYIIDANGVLQYRGGLDTSGRGPKKGEQGYKNYTAMAIDELIAGKKVSIPETKAWGCSVKYGI